MSFDQLRDLVTSGMQPTPNGIPIGFPILGDEVTIRPSTGYLIGGYTGSGKTSFLDDAFVLNPIEWLVMNPDSGLDFQLDYFSMERKKTYKLAKWVARKIFLDKGGTPMTVNKLLGWVSPQKKISREDYATFEEYEEYIEYLLSRINIIEGPQNPMGIKKIVDDYAAANGTDVAAPTPTNPYKRIYTPNNPKLLKGIIYDHVGLTKKEKRKDRNGQYISYNSKKECIDLLGEDARHFRDHYGYFYVMVSQFNRDIANPIRIKMGAVEPQLEDFKDTASTQEDADVVFGLFDAIRYNLAFPDGKDTLGYELGKFRDQWGRKKYRSLHILKNSYGIEDVGIGLAFQPELGHFKELPRSADMNDSVYRDLMDNTYFFERR